MERSSSISSGQVFCFCMDVQAAGGLVDVMDVSTRMAQRWAWHSSSATMRTPEDERDKLFNVISLEFRSHQTGEFDQETHCGKIVFFFFSLFNIHFL